MNNMLCTVLALLFSLTVPSGADEYKDFKYSRQQIEYFQINFQRDGEKIEFSGFNEDGIAQLIGAKDDLQFRSGLVYLHNDLLFDNQAMILDTYRYPYELISDCRITEDNGNVTITFLTQKDQSKLARFKKGNRFQVRDDIIIPEDDFVRGLVLDITGDIYMNGEVNKDVVSLFGDITVNANGVSRGNILSITGEVKLDNGAVIYGEIYDSKKRGRGRKHRLFRDIKWLEYDFSFAYNRVDGLSLTSTFGHKDVDSVLPSIDLKLGYGFASERGRYHIGVEQVLLHEPVLCLGGTFFRELSSEDDWLVGTAENTAYALIAREDFKDYYESEGGSIYLKYSPSKKINIEAGYKFVETNWLKSHRHLWSLFGGDKLFSYNFRSLYAPIRDIAITEIDTSSNGYLYSNIDYSSLPLNNGLSDSRWHFTGEIELSKKGLKSDFNYHRYILTVRRYQKTSNHSILLLRVQFGNSHGYVPYYKRSYLGGLGTIHGYDHKEYLGTRFWMANTEYRIDFPGSEFGFSFFWDIGQIANDQKLNSEIEIKQALGLSLFFEDDFKLSLAKRLDRSTDNTPKFYVRFSHLF